MIPAVAATGSRSGATCSARPASSRPKNRARSSRPGAGPASSRASTPTSWRQRRRGVAARVGARSADHLIFVTTTAAAGMARGGRRGDAAAEGRVLPEARPLRAGARADRRGVPVALATDVNPGGGFSPSMPFVMTLACFAMGLTFEEALVARDDQRRATRSTAPSMSAAWSRQAARRRRGGGARSICCASARPSIAAWSSAAHGVRPRRQVQDRQYVARPNSPSKLLAAFRTPDPTPGGGSASALAGAVARPCSRWSRAEVARGTAEEAARCGDAGTLPALAVELAPLADRDGVATM